VGDFVHTIDDALALQQGEKTGKEGHDRQCH
jgi:hypothetical protein